MSDAPGQQVQVELLKPGKREIIAYAGVLLHATPAAVCILARWERPRLDLGYTVFETGDRFYEYFYTDRWYTIFDLRSASGVRKGWYCNIARPAQITPALVQSEDLELDLFVSADRSVVLTLDEDEFESRGFARSAPEVYHAARAALHDLVQRARAGSEPFSD